MADPFTLAAISIGASVAGGAASAVGALSQGQSQSGMYNYQAGIAQQNQAIAKQNETYALASGESQASQSGMASRFRAGQIVAAQGASGFDVTKGSNVDVQKSQQLIADTEQTNIRSNTAKAAYDFDIGAVQAGEQASAYTAAGKNAKTAGDIGAAGSIIGTAGSVSGKWLQGQQSGAFSTNPFGF